MSMSSRWEYCKETRKVHPSSLKFLEWTTRLQLRYRTICCIFLHCFARLLSRNQSILTLQSQDVSLRTLTRTSHLLARQVDCQSTRAHRQPFQRPRLAVVSKHLSVTDDGGQGHRALRSYKPEYSDELRLQPSICLAFPQCVLLSEYNLFLSSPALHWI